MTACLARALACLCILGATAEPGDKVALVQAGLEIRSHNREGQLLGRPALLRQVAEASKFHFNCTQYPDFCKAPFNCQNAPPPALPEAKNNHANFQTWCGSPAYYKYMTTCIQKKDLRKAGRIQYRWSIQTANMGVDELDGSYCFIEGHCTNTAVTDNTTVEEAEKMCDERYGHNGWAHWKLMSETAAISSALTLGTIVMSPQTGFHDRKLTRVFLKLACAMGNYHCDVMYCKETYCKKDYYIKKYKHLEPKTPGHLLRQHNAPLFGAPI